MYEITRPGFFLKSGKNESYTWTVCVTVDASMLLALNLKAFFFPFFFLAKKAAVSAISIDRTFNVLVAISY